MTSFVGVDGLESGERFGLLSWILAPRPIAWVTSLSPHGVRNLAPFSFFTVASTDPLILMLAIEPRADDRRKDTLLNVVDTGEFVVHIVPDGLAWEVARSAEDSEPAFDEIEDLALPTVGAECVRPPLVEGCLAAFECTLLETRQPGRETLVFGRVVRAHVARRLMNQAGDVVSGALDPLGRIGPTFATIEQLDIRGMARPARP